MKIYLVIGLLIWILQPLVSVSQPIAPVKVYGALYRIPLKYKPYLPSGEIPDLYIYSPWSMGSFTSMAGEKAEGYHLRYELLNEWLEINVGGEVKILPLEELQEFTWILSGSQSWEHYINGRSYYLNERRAKGLFRVLFRGKVQLLEKIEIEVIKAYYIPQLDAGNREDTYIRSRRYYLEDSGELFLLPKKRKEVARIFSPYSSKVNIFIKREKLNLRSPRDLIRVVTFFDRLLQQ